MNYHMDPESVQEKLQMQSRDTEHEPTTDEIFQQDDIYRGLQELIQMMDKPKKECSKTECAAKLLSIAALVEKQDDVKPFVFKAAGPEMRKAAIQIVLGIIGSTLGE